MRKERKMKSNETISSDDSSVSESDEDAQDDNMNGIDDDSELSDEQNDIQHLIPNDNATINTMFDEYPSSTIDGKSGRNSNDDPERLAREEYMRRLMSFRKDELIPNEEASSSSDDGDEDGEGQTRSKQEATGVENAMEIVERIDNKM